MMTARTLTAAALACLALVAAGCGGNDSAAPTTTQAEQTTTVETTPAETTPAETPTPNASHLTTFTIVVEQGRPQGGIETFTVKKGDRVAIVTRSDTGESVHLHGYNIERPLKNGRSVIGFTANVPGRFEIELHETDVLLGNLQVEP
jgi:FtsP/CotA-like multicopper oxidase with cupredoxin domain